MTMKALKNDIYYDPMNKAIEDYLDDNNKKPDYWAFEKLRNYVVESIEEWLETNPAKDEVYNNVYNLLA